MDEKDIKGLSESITKVGEDVKSLKDTVDPAKVKTMVNDAVAEKVAGIVDSKSESIQAKVSEGIADKVEEVVKTVMAKYTGEEGTLKDLIEEQVKDLVGKTSPQDGTNPSGAPSVLKFQPAPNTPLSLIHISEPTRPY